MCNSPKDIELIPLNPSKHIGNKENIEILIINIADMVSYIERLQLTIKCYEEIYKWKQY